MRVAKAARRLAAVAALAVAALGLGGCIPYEVGPSGTLVVHADASLSEVFGQVGRELEATYPDLNVSFTFGGSTALVEQITGSVRPDVFAAADETSMAVLGDRAEGAPVAFARNQPVLVLPKGNPDLVKSLADLTRVDVALCDENEPCGRAAATVLAAAGVTITPAVTVPDSRAALAAVKSGPARAALVYRSDGRSAEADLITLEFGHSVAAVQTCSAAVLSGAANPTAARAFVDYLTSPRGREILSAAGFQEPPA